MKVVSKLFAIAAIALSCAAQAADTAPRREAVLDTGKGGLHLVVSVPSFGQGPYDFAKNKGPLINKFDRAIYGEVMFNAPVGETGVVVYQASLFRRTAIKNSDQPVTAEHLAREMIKQAGFEGRAVKIDSPQVGIEGATVVTYKMSGFAKFETERKSEKDAAIVTAVSFANDTQGYTLMATIMEKNVAAYDADPAAVEKLARGAYKDLYRNHSVNLN